MSILTTSFAPMPHPNCRSLTLILLEVTIVKDKQTKQNNQRTSLPQPSVEFTVLQLYGFLAESTT